MQRHFFSTTDDLLPVFEQVEKKLLVSYALAGLFDEDPQKKFLDGSTLPSLAKPLDVDNAVAAPGYLVTERHVAIRSRVVQQVDGGRKYAVDQLLNPDSIVVSHGGLYSSEVLISGRVETASNTPGALKLQKAFASAIARDFTRVRAYWVGPQALKLLKNGARLTASVHSPKEFDLAFG